MLRNSEEIEAMTLIRGQGEKFMRSLTITEKGKAPNIKYVIRPRINGKTLYVSFPTREAAEIFLSILPPATTNTNKRRFLDYYFAALDQITSDNTKKAYYYRMQDLKLIADKPVAMITKADYENVFLKANKASWGQIHGIMKRVSLLAEDDGFERIRRTFLSRFEYKSKQKQVRNPKEIIAALINISFDSLALERTRLAFIIMCYTGLRVGELGCLTPEDTESDSLVVRKTVVESFTYSKGNGTTTNRAGVQDRTKGKVDRIIPLPSDVKDLFKEYFDMVEMRAKGNKGMGNVKNPFIIHRKLFSEYLPKIARAAGITETITPHTARHIFGTIYGNNCQDIGEAMKLQKLLGHKNFETTQRYISIANPTADDIMSKLPSLTKKKA